MTDFFFRISLTAFCSDDFPVNRPLRYTNCFRLFVIPSEDTNPRKDVAPSDELSSLKLLPQ